MPCRQFFENNSVGDVCQHISYSLETPEEMAVVIVIPYIVVNEINRFVGELFDYMPKCRVVVIMLMKAV